MHRAIGSFPRKSWRKAVFFKSLGATVQLCLRVAGAILAPGFWLLASSSGPFWETKAPADWSDEELIRIFTDSPWAQMAQATKNESSQPVQIYLATAGPMQEAERQREIRYKRKRPDAPEDVLGEEYRAWLDENRPTQIVLAVRVAKSIAFDDAKETKRMEDECEMRVGRKKYKITGHFPPTAADPYVRLAFPRSAVSPSDKKIEFDLYVPGVAPPYRSAEFIVKDLMVKGKLEM